MPFSTKTGWGRKTSSISLLLASAPGSGLPRPPSCEVSGSGHDSSEVRERLRLGPASGWLGAEALLRCDRLSQLSSPPLKVVLSDSWGCLRTRWPLEEGKHREGSALNHPALDGGTESDRRLAGTRPIAKCTLSYCGRERVGRAKTAISAVAFSVLDKARGLKSPFSNKALTRKERKKIWGLITMTGGPVGDRFCLPMSGPCSVRRSWPDAKPAFQYPWPGWKSALT